MAISVALDPNNSAARNKEELEKALASYQTRGGEIRLPRCAVSMAPGIVWPAQRNLALVGEGAAVGYDDSFAGTQIKFTEGDIGLDLSQVDINDPSAPYSVVHGFSIHGDNLCAQGLRGSGIIHLSDMEANRFTQAGVHLARLINSTTINRLSVYGNENLGLWIGGEGESANPNNTRLIIRDLIARSNLVGVRWEQAIGATIEGGVIESNFHEGMQFYRPASNRELEDILIDRVWFEANWRGDTGYAVTMDGNGVSPSDIRFRDCHISVGGSSKAILATRLQGGLISDLRGSGAIDLAAGCENLVLLDIGSGFTVTDAGSLNGVRWRSQIGNPGGGWGLPLVTEVPLSDANATLTGAQILNTACEVTPTGNITLTLPTASAIISAFGGYVNHGSAEFVVMNRSTNASVTVTIASNTGTTIKGANTIGIGSGLFGVTMTSASTVTVYNKSIH